MTAEQAQENPPPASPAFLVLFRLSVLVALGVSGALFAQYLHPSEAGFCGRGSGCDLVRRSAYGYFFGKPYLNLPLVGLVAYGSVLWVSLALPRSPLSRLLATLGGLTALALVGVQQQVIGAFCSLCVVVDGSAIAAAVFAWLHHRASRDREARDPLTSWAWGAIAAVVAVAPVLWVRVKPAPPVPDVIRELYEPGKINVVEFADVECPFCRRLHPVLRRVLASYPPDRVHFLRKHVPLEAHEQALPAARAAVCAEARSKGEALADRLMAMTDLDPPALRRAAVELGVPGDAYDRCVASAETDRRIRADRELLEAAGMEGLPTTYVGGKRLLGAVSEPALRSAFEKAARGAEESGVPGAVYWPLVALALGGLATLGRTRRAA